MSIRVTIKRIKKAVVGLVCPPATQDLALNTKNRDATIKKYNYGPLNVDEPADYWQKIAKYWKTSEEAAKKSVCGNCVAFDISPRMKDCLPGDTFDDDGELGYCWMHHFKCHSARACHTWAKGGPIAKDSESAEWQEKNKGSLEEKLKPSMGAGAYVKDFYKSDAPQFKGKSKKERRKMAIAAYLDAKEDIKEEQLTERGASPSYCKSTPCDEMGFTQKASCKSQGIKDCYRGSKKNEGKDPKVGTGKKPKGSSRRLYTDENPKDTVSVKFASVQDIKDTLSKSSFKSKSHKRQSQIINLIHQRSRAAYRNAKDPKVKARLKKAYKYAEKRKEASKRKTKRMNKEKKK